MFARVRGVGSAAATGAAFENCIIHSCEFCFRPLEEIAAIFAVLTVWGMVFFALKLYKTFAHPYLSNDMHLRQPAEMEKKAMIPPQKFCYEELMIMTNSFADDRILGRGGFGIVYEGHVEDAGTRVSVKIINPDSHQGKNEYVSEVKSLSQLRHKNLVQLIGYCHEANKFVLVYEFIGGGSLEDHLFRGRPQLTWERRYKIALGLALSLHYLHEQCNQCVIHRDIKSSNIMLDEKLEAKLGDFGLARLVDHTRGQKTTEKIGTLGYAAPEYCETGKASKESDVYSFGVVLLEIVCGRSAVDSARAEQVPNALVNWSWSWRGRRIWRGCWRRNLLLAVEERLGKDFDKKQAEALMITGLWCVHPIAASRPSIEGAMAVLNLKAEPPKLPPKMPSYEI
ncbi:hypothetical protein BT93_E0511 [Corymbia citriodora subsp. variegata]|nr:hypothetical protein BT93_E0511 [Corymbia citriodora subsp. variegata]